MLDDLTYWKHVYADILKWPSAFNKPLVILLCLKHPAAWIASIQRRSYELFPEYKPGRRRSGSWREENDFSWLFGRQGKISWRVGYRCTGDYLPRRTWDNAAELWLNYVQEYLQLNPAIEPVRIYIVRNEDLIISQQNVHAQLHAIGLRSKMDDTPDITLHTKDKTTTLQATQQKMRQSEY